ncbi:MAG TPA: septation regulator SpoVG [bacterium]|jgi:stage V sporulation protein G|nr:septation regulator SpoVG [Dictyoglomota bacterium]HHV81731.1 septation regulator SpoVG [bacterium]HOL55202.1 septation regulator SpoVG [bacterium]HON72263.1 septation regulator SpoVG [bacterium]HOP56041.1 septation regulator SpoVG [bacterium]
MNITDVRIKKVTSQEGKVKAFASITFDDAFVVHGLKVIDGKNGYFVAMPRRDVGNGEFKDIAHPINNQMRENIQSAVLEAFNKSQD